MPPVLLPLPPALFTGKIHAWSEIKPYYDELNAMALDAGSFPAWIERLDTLHRILGDTASRLYAESAGDSTDAVRQAAKRAFDTDIQPEVDKAFQAANLKLLASGQSRPGMEQVLRHYRAWSELFRDENIPVYVELEGLVTDYHDLVGHQKVQFQGAEHTVEGMHRFQMDADRAVREAAWRATGEAALAQRRELHESFDRMLDKRQTLARNAGFERYVDFNFKQNLRYEVDAQDCLDFDDAIAATAVPLACKLTDLRKRELGLDRVEAWDMQVDLFGTVSSITPQGIEGLKDGVAAMLHKACPSVAGHFDRMRKLGNLDLEDRPGKQGGGFCNAFPLDKSCFILMSANGTPQDVNTLAHEGGHAVHFMEAMARQPLDLMVWGPADCCEMVAMSMELLVLPHLGALYSPEDCARVRLKDLMGVAGSLAYIASIDAFQHWAHDHIGCSHAQRDEAAAAIAARFCPERGWERHSDFQATFWQRKQHVFMVPFYYINYAFAQLGALQVWQNSLRDPALAGKKLAEVMAQGGTLDRAAFFAAAGAEFRWDLPMLERLMADLEQAINTELKALGREPLGV